MKTNCYLITIEKKSSGIGFVLVTEVILEGLIIERDANYISPVIIIFDI